MQQLRPRTSLDNWYPVIHGVIDRDDWVVLSGQVGADSVSVCDVLSGNYDDVLQLGDSHSIAHEKSKGCEQRWASYTQGVPIFLEG